MTGLTGLIKFDHEGFRTDIQLDIVEVTAEGLVKKGSWNTSEGINFTQTLIEPEEEVDSIMDMRNVTFVVMISLVRSLATILLNVVKIIQILIDDRILIVNNLKFLDFKAVNNCSLDYNIAAFSPSILLVNVLHITTA